MKLSFYTSAAFTGYPSASAGYTVLTASRDFLTPDGVIVPRALGEAGLRQRTAMLVGGMLIGNWPDHL